MFGRYGRRQVWAPLPGTRVIIKDPFAMLSVPVISTETGAQAVQVFRHPGAVLASYRRMGWTPDLDEIAHLVESHRDTGDGVHELWGRRSRGISDAEEMAIFWNVLTSLALDDVARVSATIVVAHEELASLGEPAAEELFARLDLRFTEATAAEMTKQGGDAARRVRICIG